MTRDLRALPWPQMRIKLAPQFRNLAAQAFQLRVGVFIAGKMPQLFDVFLQALDLLLAVKRRRDSFVFFFCAHGVTVAAL
jgi:hypothetical protein